MFLLELLRSIVESKYVGLANFTFMALDLVQEIIGGIVINVYKRLNKKYQKVHNNWGPNILYNTK